MKVYLMYRDRDFDIQRELPSNANVLCRDLELDTLFATMSLGDEFLVAVIKKAVLLSLTKTDEIQYRQDIVKDCLYNRETVRALYDISLEAIEAEKRVYCGIFGRYPDTILARSIKVLKMFAEQLKKIKSIVQKSADRFVSEGYRRFFQMVCTELNDEYLEQIQEQLRVLEFHAGVLISAGIGDYNRGCNYVLRKPQEVRKSWLSKIFAPKDSEYSFIISEKDDSGMQALSELKGRGINLVANALAQSTDHILSFFQMLRTELGLYIGAINLFEQLQKSEGAICFPEPVNLSECNLSFRGLYDVCLALTLKKPVVSNDLNAENKDLIMITGANQGGKSTFLRSIGLAQLMMQCGLFVTADSFRSSILTGIFTHYRKEEDSAMNSGKLDEELSRMNAIVNALKPNAMVLFNESFAATNEREGSEIAKQIVCALLENHVKVIFVTHLYVFSHTFYQEMKRNYLFLRADRHENGRRTFKIMEGEPLQTSFGLDLYNGIFNQ